MPRYTLVSFADHRGASTAIDVVEDNPWLVLSRHGYRLGCFGGELFEGARSLGIVERTGRGKHCVYELRKAAAIG